MLLVLFYLRFKFKILLLFFMNNLIILYFIFKNGKIRKGNRKLN